MLERAVRIYIPQAPCAMGSGLPSAQAILPHPTFLQSLTPSTLSCPQVESPTLTSGPANLPNPSLLVLGAK